MGWIWITLPLTLGCIGLPLVYPGEVDRHLPLLERHWVKANLWIGIFNFVGNYFLTHYFFKVLGCKYTMDTYTINGIPIMMFLATQAYFMLYHSLSNMFQRALYSFNIPTIGVLALVWAFSCAVAFLEAFTLQKFPYYVHEDTYKMYTIGSVFYSLYLIVSFPMFYRIDEYPSKARQWSIKQVALDGFAASMIVFILLDFWRIIIGNIHGSSLETQVPFL